MQTSKPGLAGLSKSRHAQGSSPRQAKAGQQPWQAEKRRPGQVRQRGTGRHSNEGLSMSPRETQQAGRYAGRHRQVVTCTQVQAGTQGLRSGEEGSIAWIGRQRKTWTRKHQQALSALYRYFYTDSQVGGLRKEGKQASRRPIQAIMQL